MSQYSLRIDIFWQYKYLFKIDIIDVWIYCVRLSRTVQLQCAIVATIISKKKNEDYFIYDNSDNQNAKPFSVVSTDLKKELSYIKKQN